MLGGTLKFTTSREASSILKSIVPKYLSTTALISEFSGTSFVMLCFFHCTSYEPLSSEEKTTSISLKFLKSVPLLKIWVPLTYKVQKSGLKKYNPSLCMITDASDTVATK